MEKKKFGLSSQSDEWKNRLQQQTFSDNPKIDRLCKNMLRDVIEATLYNRRSPIISTVEFGLLTDVVGAIYIDSRHFELFKKHLYLFLIQA